MLCMIFFIILVENMEFNNLFEGLVLVFGFLVVVFRLVVVIFVDCVEGLMIFVLRFEIFLLLNFVMLDLVLFFIIDGIDEGLMLFFVVRFSRENIVMVNGVCCMCE